MYRPDAYRGFSTRAGGGVKGSRLEATKRGGGKGLATKKKELFFEAREKKIPKKMWPLSLSGRAAKKKERNFFSAILNN